MSARKRRRPSADREEAITITAENKDIELEPAAIAKPMDINSEPAKTSHNPPVSQTKSLYVHSLPRSATSENLTAFFSQEYPIKHATIVVDPVTKASRGYGFVTFVDCKDAQTARQKFDGATLCGRKIGVKIAEPRQRSLSQGGNLLGKRSHSPTLIEPKHCLVSKKPRALPLPKLIVRNLPWSISEPDQLAALANKFGKVKQATVPKKGPGKSAGFGFIVMRGRKNAENALKSLNGRVVEGRTLAVDWAVEKDIWDTSQKDATAEIVELQEYKESTIPQLTLGSLVRDNENDSNHGLNGNSPEEIKETMNKTLFVRNIPFGVTDELLQNHFTTFGPIRYARMVMDATTNSSRGVGFVCFYSQQDSNTCLRNAPAFNSPVKESLLEDLGADPSGLYTMHDRVLRLSRAVDKSEAERLKYANRSLNASVDKDKRRLYLLDEGAISVKSRLYQQLGVKEMRFREDSAKKRQALVKRNPFLHLSLTRLSIRNIPLDVTSKDLKALARKAVVEFAKDVKAGIRKPLSKEELSRGGNDQKAAERERKCRGVGIVKQAKIVFETREGRKVAEGTGAGRSSGFGFIEYTSHRWALMGLRWLNGLAARDLQGSSRKETKETKGRLVVEFAIENTRLIGQRREREISARNRSKTRSPGNKQEAGEAYVKT